MYKLLTLLAFASCVYAAQAGCLGCAFEDTTNSEDVLPDLKMVLEEVKLNVEVKSIEKVTKQVTGGMKYTVLFTTVDDRKCAASWLSRPWESKTPLYPKASCQ